LRGPVGRAQPRRGSALPSLGDQAGEPLKRSCLCSLSACSIPARWVLHFPLPGPVFHRCSESGAHGIAPDVVELFRITRCGAQAVVPAARLPFPLRLSVPPGKAALPVRDPAFDRGAASGRGAKKMEVVRHQHIIPDAPCIRLRPRFAHQNMIVSAGEPAPAVSRMDGQKNNGGTIVLPLHSRTGPAWRKRGHLDSRKLRQEDVERRVRRKTGSRAANGRGPVGRAKPRREPRATLVERACWEQSLGGSLGPPSLRGPVGRAKPRGTREWRACGKEGPVRRYAGQERWRVWRAG
jgi:hypothetical protein